MYGSWDMVHNRWTDRRKKWHIEVGAPPTQNKNMALQFLSTLLLQALHLSLWILMQKLSILMLSKLNILMLHKNDVYNVAKMNVLMFQKQVM